MEVLRQRFDALRARLGPRGTVLAAAGLAVVIVALIVGHRIYVHVDTGGIGYVDAADLVLAGTDDTDTRKRHFFEALAPVIEAENARILAQREKLVAARDAGDAGVASRFADDYGVEWTGDEWQALLARVDAVPLQLALIQAAKESGWGRSRFAEDANNLFGQWCFTEGCGIVPRKRREGASHEVKDFASVNHAVRSYLKNINTHRAYRALRRVRARARAAGKTASSTDLARTLTSYSERGEAYVEEIISLIRTNRSLMPEGTG